MQENARLSDVLAGCRDGDSESFSQLVDMYSGRCYGYFYRLTGNRGISEDLLSELFARVVEKIGSFKGAYFDGWLFKVASNIFHDYLRSNLRRGRFLERQQSLLTEQASAEPPYEGEKTDELQKRLFELDDETRELIMLRFYSQLSFKEIAKMRSEPIGTTLSKVHRGLKKLRDLME